jgi:S-adenosylmethionine synthetase
MKKSLFTLSLLALLTASFSASALTQGEAGLLSLTHSNTDTTSTVTGTASMSFDAVAVIQPMVFAPKMIVGKVSAMGSAINTIQRMLDAPKLN